MSDVQANGPELPQPVAFHVEHDECWRSDFTGQSDGSVHVRVSGPGGRSWQAQRADIEQAVAVSGVILLEQRLASEPAPAPAAEEAEQSTVSSVQGVL